jgi:hypothetical protein
VEVIGCLNLCVIEVVKQGYLGGLALVKSLAKELDFSLELCSCDFWGLLELSDVELTLLP